MCHCHSARAVADSRRGCRGGGHVLTAPRCIVRIADMRLRAWSTKERPPWVQGRKLTPTFETNFLKAFYFQPVETKRFHRGVTI